MAEDIVSNSDPGSTAENKETGGQNIPDELNQIGSDDQDIYIHLLNLSEDDED